MKIVQRIIEETPKWAAKGQVLLVFVFTTIVALQQTNVIDILPIDKTKRDAIKAWGAVAAIVGGLFLAGQKKASVSTTVTAPPEPKIDINQDISSLKP